LRLGSTSQTREEGEYLNDMISEGFLMRWQGRSAPARCPSI